jgi:hypothetical protein
MEAATMSDTQDDSTPIRRLDQHVPKSRRAQAAARERDGQRSPTVAEVREWIVAGSAAAGQKAYSQLAEQHRAVFEMQESAMDLVNGAIHARLSILEEQSGIASPPFLTVREALDRLVEGMADTEQPGG